MAIEVSVPHTAVQTDDFGQTIIINVRQTNLLKSRG